MKTWLISLLLLASLYSCKHENLQSDKRQMLYQVGLNFAKQDIHFPANSKFYPKPQYVAYDSFANEYIVKGNVDDYDSIGRLEHLVWVVRFRSLDNKHWSRTDEGTEVYYIKGVPTEIK